MVKLKEKGAGSEMNTKTIAIIAVAVIAVAAVVFLFVGGYISFKQPSEFKSEKAASGAVTEIGSGVQDIASTLGELEKKLG